MLFVFFGVTSTLKDEDGDFSKASSEQDIQDLMKQGRLAALLFDPSSAISL
jgi:hypothetical protein